MTETFGVFWVCLMFHSVLYQNRIIPVLFFFYLKVGPRDKHFQVNTNNIFWPLTCFPRFFLFIIILMVGSDKARAFPLPQPSQLYHLFA